MADLASCDREAIRVPGAIQPHGRLLVLDAHTREPLAWSANWPSGDRAGIADAIRSMPFDEVLESAAPRAIGRMHVADHTFDVTAQRNARHLLIEFEDPSPRAGSEAPIYSLTREFLPRLQDAQTVGELCQLAADEIRRLTGFGRSLVYFFDEEDHGQVLAENIDPGYDSYIGHHFPASDIPRQARELYLVNQFRLIPDAHYEPVPIEVVDSGLSPQDIDLSGTSLRSVSPVHLEYMRNMGTIASMSVSIVIEGRLWGLISCHDHAARRLDAPTRLACEHLGQLLAMQIRAKQTNIDTAERLELRKLTLEIVSHLSDGDASLHRLIDEPSLLLRLARAGGAAVLLDDEVWCTGETPGVDEIQELGRWILGLGQPVYESHSLAQTFVPAQAYAAQACGVLAISISQVHRHLIFWFRPELVQTVKWAGDPRKELREAGRIHPRRSFTSWVEQIRGRSLPWSAAEIGAAGELRQALIAIVLRRAEELAEVATELGRVNKELEAFSYTVSHDLRAPMRHIAGYVDLVLDFEGRQISERGHRYLKQVKDAAAFAGLLVDSLLDFSRMGRAALKRRMVDCNLLVEGLVRELTRQEPDAAVEFEIDPKLPVLYADPLLLQVATRNLLTNAMKYSRKRTPAHIRVRAVHNDHGAGLEVVDNGVGFQMKYVGKLFGVFQRLHQAEDFEGTGIGLANVKRIIERHGGQVWAQGAVDEGASFGFILPPAADAQPT